MPFGFTLKKDRKEIMLPAWGGSMAQNAIWGDMADAASYAAQAERYTKSDLIYMCVNRLSEMAAMNSHRLMVFNSESKRDPETGFPTEVIEDHPFLELWRNPNPWDSSFEFTESLSITLNLTGNGYFSADDGSKPFVRGGKKWVECRGEPQALWLMRPDRVSIIPDRQKFITGYKYTVSNEDTYVSPEAVRHFKLYHPLRDYDGLSRVEPINYASAGDIMAQQSNYALFKNGLRLSVVVESDRDRVDLGEQQLMEKMLREKYTGDPAKAYQVAFLWQDFKLREMGMNMRDAEFIKGSQMNRMRIFGAFGVHPAVILSEDVNKANAQIGEYFTLKFTVAPMLERIAAEIKQLLKKWPEYPPAESHFVGVVPQDVSLEATVASNKAAAAQKFIQALGDEEGIKEAQRQGVLTKEVNIKKILDKPKPTVPALPAPGGKPGNGFDQSLDNSQNPNTNENGAGRIAAPPNGKSRNGHGSYAELIATLQEGIALVK